MTTKIVRLRVTPLTPHPSWENLNSQNIWFVNLINFTNNFTNVLFDFTCVVIKTFS